MPALTPTHATDAGGKHEHNQDALAAARAEVASLRENLTYAKYTLESVQPEVGYECECEDCDECGLEVAECSKIECSKTCNCSICRPCIVQDAINGFDALLAPEPHGSAGSGGEGRGRDA